MTDLTSLASNTPHAASYAAPTPAPASAPPSTPAARPAAPAAAPEHSATSATRPAQPAKAEHTADVTAGGFNPSVTIDPDTHILVMTTRSPDGDVLRQMPNQHELAAYKARATEHKKEV